MNRTALGMALAALAAAAACDSPMAPGTGAVAVPGDMESLTTAAASPIVASAAGAAHRDALGRPAILNFSARKRADGSVEGHYYFRALGTDPDQWIRVRVTCMTVVDGNRAFIGGIAEEAFLPALVGRVSYFYAFDNGEGADAGDIVSRVRAGDVDEALEEFCTELPQILTPFEVLRGDVLVSG